LDLVFTFCRFVCCQGAFFAFDGSRPLVNNGISFVFTQDDNLICTRWSLVCTDLLTASADSDGSSGLGSESREKGIAA